MTLAFGDAGTEIEPIPQDMLRKYISYSKRYIKPKLSSGDLPKIAQVYAELRRESVTREAGGGNLTLKHHPLCTGYSVIEQSQMNE